MTWLPLIVVAVVVILFALEGWSQSLNWRKAYGDRPFYDDSMGG